jgi:cyclopropane-fatty-acyl-phospholipid synthase
MSCSSNTKRGWWSPLLRINGVTLAKYVLHEILRRNTISKARKNISAHYDLVSGFLSENISLPSA